MTQIVFVVLAQSGQVQLRGMDGIAGTVGMGLLFYDHDEPVAA